MQMPATANTRAARMRPCPPARSSVQRIRPRAPRTNSSAQIAHANAIGIAQAASTSVRLEFWRDRTMAAGTTSAATRAVKNAREARWLLLRVRAANGGGRNRASDHTGHGDERQDVWKGLEQHCCRVRVGREPER